MSSDKKDTRHGIPTTPGTPSTHPARPTTPGTPSTHPARAGIPTTPGIPATAARDATAEQAAVCFVAGTRIRSATGEIPVEALAVGDMVVTASGAARAVTWLGHRTIDCRRHSRRHEVMPIRIAAHAFGPATPARDLYVSPGHAICVAAFGEVLIPAGTLVNGTTVTQIEVETVTYWHIELESHDIVLAEGLPSESYLEMGNRRFFTEGGVVALDAAPDAGLTRTHDDFCRPFHTSGPLVEAVRARLRAGAASLQPAAWRRTS